MLFGSPPKIESWKVLHIDMDFEAKTPAHK